MLSPISGSTRLAAVIGDPVVHSRSPAIHNAAFDATGLDWRYLALEVAAGRGADAVEAMRVLGIGGLSVTMPHKAAVAAAVDERTPAVEALGVCNCVFWRGDRLVGDNTDGDGFVSALMADTDHCLDGARVVVVGAGGAARSIIEAIGRSGATQIGVVNRTEKRAAEAARLAPQAMVVSEDDIALADIVINTSSVGMHGSSGEGLLAVDPALLRSGQLVADIVYAPELTPILAAARAKGLATLGGIPMLVHQAVAQFEHWTGVPAPLDVMATAARS